MMKRFNVRKVRQYAYSRQGWCLADKGFIFAIYDHEWKKNHEACEGGLMFDHSKKFKCVETSYSKEVAQFWANWLNENKANVFGEKITIPGKIFQQGLDLYKANSLVA